MSQVLSRAHLGDGPPPAQETRTIDLQNVQHPERTSPRPEPTDTYRRMTMNLIKSLFLALILSVASLGVFAASININTATAEQLTALNGIGDAKAAAIVEHRKAHGLFKSVDQLVDVKGIGLKLVEKNRDLMTVGGKS
jgi:competence protein ComEA